MKTILGCAAPYVVRDSQHPSERLDDMRWMAPFEAVGIIESLDGESHDEEELLSAWQNLVDSGVVWQLQGWYGRAAVNLIERGLVTVKGGESNGNLHFVNSRSE